MSHLTEEQFEDVIQGSIPEPEHISECEDCKRALEEKRAIAQRLHNAFASIKPNEEFVANVRLKLDSFTKVSKREHHAKTVRMLSFKAIAWQAAAALLVIGILIGIHVLGPDSAMAAPAELVKIHQSNLSDNHMFYSESDPEKLAEYFKDELGFSPSLPELGHGMALRGCCVKHFRGQVAGSYVVDTPNGVMSIIVVTDSMKSLGMNELFQLIIFQKRQ